MVKFHDPRGEIATEIDAYELSLDISANDGEGVTVGLLANGFPDSELFMTKIDNSLRKRLTKVSTKLWNKHNAAMVVSDGMLAEINANCQVAIAAYGH